MREGVTRREFVRSGLWGAGALISLQLPRPRAAAAAAKSTTPVTLTPLEWNTLEAITGRIIPTDHEPGAIEAGCVNFIDKALAHEDTAALPLYRGGLAAIDGIAKARFDEPFAEASTDEQDALLRDLETGNAAEWRIAELPPQLFFETLRAHTIVGFVADPRHGGNRDYAGWRVSGYPGPRHAMGGYTEEQVRGEAPIVPIWEREPA